MCDCIQLVNKQLGEQDLRLVTTWPLSAGLDLNPPRVTLATERLTRSRKQRPTLSATFCPFCGERYEQPVAATAETRETPHARA